MDFNLEDIRSTKRIGTLPFRSHYIPFSVNDKFGYKNHIIDKYSSSEVISLNGVWDFIDHKSLSDINKIDELLNRKIDVPSCVQCYGYDYFQYTNLIYPFPFKPPYVPDENPVFHYRKKFNIIHKSKVFLIFEGVDSAFYLFINNRKVGYSQITHSKSEFDITEYVVDGENIVDVVVLKWCASSYLEDQDKFRFTGIFRDVYILNRPYNYIWDYKIEPIKKDNKWIVLFTNLSNIDLTILFGNKVFVAYKKQSVEIPINNPKLWTAEHPYLYELIIKTSEEKIYERFGLRDVKIKDGIFLINDKHIKLKGVNRHESNPKTGATVTIEDTEKDILLIKSINANAIRTSHYPDIPEFYELCDYHGLYIVDEADLESHGAAGEDYSLQRWQDFANSGLYDDAVTDREMSLYERDKNRTCVIIWSLGNESNYGTMFHNGADYIHSHDSRPIHYEGIYNLVDKSDYYTNRIDICSRMYPSIEQIQKEYLNDKKEKRPLLICEYTHAMGNSCGDVKDYWEIINSSDRIIGAFLWEWCDHAVLVNGQLKYGSDFPEHHNDGNFCCDGLVTPYRVFKSSTYEVKSIYQNDFKEPILKRKKINLKQSDKKFETIINDDSSINLVYQNKNILLSPIEINVTRANIDNEMHDGKEIDTFRKCKKIIKNENNDSFDVDFVNNLDELMLSVHLIYKIQNDVLALKVSYKKHTNFYLQRLGIKFSLEYVNNSFEYYGFGPYENYVDKHNSCRIGKFKINAKDNLMPYIKPQDYGSRYYCSYLKSKNLIVTADNPFSFSILPNSEEEIMASKHDYELPTSNKAYINLDVAMSGVGSHSCGPVLNKKYSVPDEGENTFYIQLIK